MAIITLTTDFGYTDPYVASMKGIILSVNPYAKIVDISHDITPQNIWQASWTIFSSYSYFPKQSIHICVVDPGVGSSRKPILIETNNCYFIGPNNGVFTEVIEKETITKVIELTDKKYFLNEISKTFHGRDIFAPVAANLSKGTKSENFGNEFDINQLVKLPDSSLIVKEKNILGIIKHIDRFGNLITNIPNNVVPESIKGKVKNKPFKGLYDNYSQANSNELFAIKGSHGFIEISMYLGSAQRFTNAQISDRIEIKF